MIKYSAKIIHLCQDIEEAVTLKVNNLEITCFASVCSYPIIIGEEYPVTFNFLDFELSEQHHVRETSLKRIGNTYRHELKGMLCNGVIDAGIKVRDEYLLSSFRYLNNKYICLDVERLDVEFL